MKKRTYFGLVLLSAMALLGASCRYQPPVPTENGTSSEAMKESSTQAKKPASDDKMMKDDSAEKMDSSDKMDETMKKDDAMMEDEAMKEDAMMEEKSDDVMMEEAKGRTSLRSYEADVDDKSIVFFLAGVKGEYKGNDAVFETTCKTLLVPMKVELEKSQSDLATAVVQLLTSKKAKYEDQGLLNAVISHGLTLENIHYEDGVRIIDFSGEPTFEDACEAERVKAQVEETIKLYSDKFEIRLNESHEAWEKAFTV